MAELDQALEVLSVVVRLRDEGRLRFDDCVDRQLAVAQCWANIGEPGAPMVWGGWDSNPRPRDYEGNPGGGLTSAKGR